MTFKPKYLPYREALRVVAERANLKQGQINPLCLALDESAIIPEVRRAGGWTKLLKGDWQSLSVWFPNPLVGNYQAPNEGQIAHTDVRILTDDIDKLWQPTAASSGGAIAKPLLEKKRGPKAHTLARVIAEMRVAGGFAAVDGIAEEALATQYDASRDTIRKARNTLELEIAGKKNLQQLATNDN